MKILQADNTQIVMDVSQDEFDYIHALAGHGNSFAISAGELGLGVGSQIYDPIIEIQKVSPMRNLFEIDFEAGLKKAKAKNV